jgi:hypothetical protein
LPRSPPRPGRRECGALQSGLLAAPRAPGQGAVRGEEGGKEGEGGGGGGGEERQVVLDVPQVSTEPASAEPNWRGAPREGAGAS